MLTAISMQTVLKEIPVMEAKNPADRLVEFYKKIGWDGERVLDPTKVKVTQKDYERLVHGEIEHAKEAFPEISQPTINFEIGFLWCNTGPSGNGNIPGKVEILPGWLN